jgi:hypothetical protein
MTRRTSLALVVAATMVLAALPATPLAEARHESRVGPVVANPLNHAPFADAGPTPIVIDGGAHDVDGVVDGDANYDMNAKVTDEVDEGSFNETGCHLSVTQGSETHYYWYRNQASREGQPMTEGTYMSSAPFWDVERGLTPVFLAVEDTCEAVGTDQGRIFVGTDRTPVASWSFDEGVPSAWSLEDPWQVTDACELENDGGNPYLGFTRVDASTDPTCRYAVDEPTAANATVSLALPDDDFLGVEFDTRWDTRDGAGSPPEDVLRVQASFDGGETWTPSNRSLAVERGHDDSSLTWDYVSSRPASSVFDLRDRDVVAGDEVLLRFQVDTGTVPDDDGFGWLVDDVTVLDLEA